MFHVWRNWLKRHWQALQQERPVRRSKPRFRPQLEVLEDRRLLATLTVNNVADTANPNDNFLTLREAIQVVNGKVNINQLSAAAQNQINTKANPLGTNDIIQFNIGAGTQTISVTGSALDTITKPVNMDGTAPAGNPDQVIVLDGTSFQNAKKGINGLTLSAANVTVNLLTIQNFTGYGIQINAPMGADKGKTQDTIKADTILGNSYFGIWLNGSSYNIIGWNDKINKKAVGNDIEGNKNGGIRVSGNNDDHNVFQGNTIVNNTGQGIYLDSNANATTIGSMDTKYLGNIIAGNTLDGIRIGSSSNFVGANYIGIQPSEEFAAGLNNGNGGNGISVYGNDNYIGKKDDSSRNVISANAKNGVYISSNVTDNYVDNNYIGTDLTGDNAFDGKGNITGNKGDGVLINSCPKNNIGVNASNVIAANLGNGIEINGDGTAATAGNTVSNNIIGASATADPMDGRTPLGNGKTGILVNKAENTSISNNTGFKGEGQMALEIQNVKQRGTIKGNKIVNLPPPAPGGGQSSLPIPSIEIVNSSGINVGGTNPGDGNVIDDGLAILNSSNIVVQGNLIGVDANGNSFDNPGNGITIDESSNNNTIGGSGPGGANTIKDNGGAGVSVISGVNNLISQNIIAFNDGLGIDLGGNGVSLPGSQDTVPGPNYYQNYPVLNSVQINGNTVTIVGSLNSTPDTTFTLEFFDNGTAAPSGYGQGQVYFGSTSVTTDPSGNGNFTVTFNLPSNWVGPYVTATATNPEDNTSEFSRNSLAYSPGTIGGEAWNDFNTNGILEPYETGLPNVSVNLFDADNQSLVASTTTDASGNYEFDNQAAGNYYVQFVAPAGYVFSPQNAGSNSTTNSLADPTTGDTPTFALADGSVVADVNAGLSDTRPAPTVTLTSDTNPSVYGQDVTFTATVAAETGTPTGTVSFLDGTTPLGTSVLDATGTATLDDSWLAVGNHTIQAVYNGDANNAPASSATLSQQVNQDPTDVTLSTSGTPSSLGDSVTFTAVVSAASPGSGLPTGTVTFYDGNTLLESATLDATGTATLSTSSLSLGSHLITADYSGDVDFLASSATLTQQVNQSDTVTLTDSSGPVVVGQPFTLTAVVSGSGATPTGTISFIADGVQDLGDVTLDDTGTASLSAYLLTVGSHNIQAVYNGDSNYGISTSNTVVQQVNQAATATTVGTSGSPAMVGQPVTFTASVTVNSPGQGIPTGTVSFYDGSTQLGTGSLDAYGNATLTTSSLALGSHDITATYSGDDNFTGSSGSLTQVISGEVASSVSLSSSADPATLNQAVTFTATVSGAYGTPTGSVTFLDGDTLLGTATLDDTGTATLTTSSLTLGDQTITAVYSGDATYNDSSASLTQTVNQAATTTTLSSDTNPAQPGQNVTFTATVTPSGMQEGTPMGSVTFYDGTNMLGNATVDANGEAAWSTTSLALGDHTITAVYSGDDTFAGSSATLTQTVASQPITTTTSLSSGNSQPLPGQTVTFTASLSTEGQGTPTGTVTFLDGSTVLGTATLDGNGNAVLSTATLPIGADPITAVYNGSTTFAPSSAQMTQTVAQGLTSLVLSSSDYAVNPGENVTFTANVASDGQGTPTGSVTFLDGTTTLGTSSLDANGNASYSTSSLSAGNHAITAIYEGSSTFVSSSSSITQTVIEEPNSGLSSSTSLSSSPNASLPDQSVTFTATVSGSGVTPSGSVTFYNGTSVLGSESLEGNGVATITTSSLGLGNSNITAIYSGDSTYIGSAASMNQAVSLDPSSVSLATSATGQEATLTATVSGSGVTPTGSVTFYDGSSVLGTATLDGNGNASLTTTLAVGDHLLFAVYSGDSTYAASDSYSQSQSISPVASTISVSSSSSPSLAGQSVTFTATVSGGYGTATGSVTFLDGTTVLGTVTLDGNGMASLTTSSLGLGSHDIIAIYSGDSVYASSAASLTQAVVQADSTTSLSSSANPSPLGQSVTFTATVAASDPNDGTPTGTVAFYDGTTFLGTGTLTLVNGQLQATFTTSALGLGSHDIIAIYSGDDTFADSASSLEQTISS